MMLGEAGVHWKADAGHELSEREKGNNRCWTARIPTANRGVSGQRF